MKLCHKNLYQFLSLLTYFFIISLRNNAGSINHLTTLITKFYRTKPLWHTKQYKSTSRVLRSLAASIIPQRGIHTRPRAQCTLTSRTCTCSHSSYICLVHRPCLVITVLHARRCDTLRPRGLIHALPARLLYSLRAPVRAQRTGS